VVAGQAVGRDPRFHGTSAEALLGPVRSEPQPSVPTLRPQTGSTEPMGIAERWTEVNYASRPAVPPDGSGS